MWLFQDPITLSDGVTIYPTKFDSDSKAQSGYKNVGWDNQSNKYIAGVRREQAATVDSRLTDAQPDNRSFFLGRFRDPRVAAWVANNFLQNPPDSNFIDNYLNNTVIKFGKEGLAAMYKLNDLSLPEDLFALPITPGTRQYFDEIKQVEDKSADDKAKKLGFNDAEEMKQALEKGIKTGEEWQRHLKNERDHVQRVKDQGGELKFSELLKNPEFKKAWDATGEEKHDARDWVIQKVQQGSSDDEILQGLRNYLSESALRRILSLSGIIK